MSWSRDYVLLVHVPGTSLSVTASTMCIHTHSAHAVRSTSTGRMGMLSDRLFGVCWCSLCSVHWIVLSFQLHSYTLFLLDMRCVTLAERSTHQRHLACVHNATPGKIALAALSLLTSVTCSTLVVHLTTAVHSAGTRTWCRVGRLNNTQRTCWSS